MRDSLKKLAAKFSPFNKTPAKAGTPAAPVMEADDDTEAYSAAMAEDLINGLIDRHEETLAKMRALVKVNHALSAQLTEANATINQLYRQPKNKYWGVVNQRKGK